MKYRLIAAAALLTTLPLAQAQDSGSWIVRARALNLDSTNKDSTGFGLTINNKVFPEVDISYFLSPNLAAELVLTYPQKQTIHSTAVGADIGTFKHLPPSLMLQYHVTGLAGFRPYVGAGVNYTNLSSVHFASNVAGLHLGVKHQSFGLAAQVVADIPMGGGWLFNVDLKKVQIGTTVYSSGASVGKLKLDPVLFSLGVGKRF
ncbi:MAG: OmpW family protein [Burkholderiales bacterium]|nr:OmpW family protein [Burkholderiales bacterium]